MPKASHDIQELKRSLTHLMQLEGRALACSEGAVLLEPLRVKDPRPLVKACQEGRPTLESVRASLELAAPPVALTPHLLAAAQRDLRVLESSPALVALTHEAPRIFRRYGDIDAAWIARKRDRIARLAEVMHAAERPAEARDGAHPPWFLRVLEVMGFLHGDTAREAVEQSLAHLLEEMLARLPSPRGAIFSEEALRFFAHYALAFDPRPRDGGLLQVSRAVIEQGLQRLGPVLNQLGGRKLTIAEVLVLERIEPGYAVEPIASLVEAGLSIDKVRKVAALGRIKELARLKPGSSMAEAYVDWVCTLVPHYATLGIDLPFTPEAFARLRVPRKEELAVLAVCLMNHHTRAAPDSTEQALARLDATLGLFQRRPAEAASIVAELSGTSPGAGREAFPEFATWLGDDALLDRFVHVARLAGISDPLSQRLRADFERAERLARERAHLTGLSTRSDAQEERLARLEAGLVATGTPERTRRRLAERVRELSALAYERKLDAVFLRILKEVWGISLASLTPAWRDAIRFYLVVEDNRELLGSLLRAAAAGVEVARTFPRNRAYLSEARLHFNVEEWLAPRSREVSVDGKPYRICREQDPIEVLRMGIPFDTCLSLLEGCNAASTVLNAVDVNKAVIYLRDARGQIVARKLLAVSRDYALLGYQLYVADSAHREAIARIFRDFCRELSTATRLPFVSSGMPREIHPGFWYDDGVVGDEEMGEDVSTADYCASLGQPVPRLMTAELRQEARIFNALRSGDEGAVLAALSRGWWTSGIRGRAAEWLLSRMPAARLVTEARSCQLLATVAMRRAAEEGPLPFLELAGRIADWRSANEVADHLPRFPRTEEIAQALVSAALASRRNAPRFDDHGLEHQSLSLLPAFAAELPVAVSLNLCDRIEPLWRWLPEVSSGCGSCVRTAEDALIRVITRRYASARNPAIVIQYLGRNRVGRLARRVALRIAARYSLAEEATAPSLPRPRLEPLRPSPPALRALLRLRKRHPELEAEPELLAALLRQSGGNPLPRGVTLPTPRKAPFKALGDLLVQQQLRDLVARWPPPSYTRAEQEADIQAFTRIDRHLSGDAVAPEEVFAALRHAQKANLSWGAYQPIVERLVTRQAQGLTQQERSFVAWYLQERTTERHPEVSARMMVALWRVEELRGDLVTMLAKAGESFFKVSYPSIVEAARREGGVTLVEGLLEAVVEALLELGRYEVLADIEDDALCQKVFRVSLSKVSAAGAMALYKAIQGYESAATFVRELSRSPLRESEALRTQLELAREKGSRSVGKMPLEWLEAPSAGTSR
ncbi:hypothetical protein [Hyalangium gracile]|uniref:hypothetical protein n=1 Tax=Hyalangium gracile TaxID=394092 RepID=UPI001CCF1C5C|nr:hypothetical protein [Hyalangium gracile]